MICFILINKSVYINLKSSVIQNDNIQKSKTNIIRIYVILILSYQHSHVKKKLTCTHDIRMNYFLSSFNLFICW